MPGTARLVTRTLVGLMGAGLGMSAVAADAPARAYFECRLGAARWASAYDAGAGSELEGIQCQPASGGPADTIARAAGDAPANWRPFRLIVASPEQAQASGLFHGQVSMGVPAYRPGARVLAWLVRETALQAGVDPDLAHAVAHVESNLNPAAQSPRGALGLMQIMPATASELGVRSRAELLRPATNARLGVAYLLAMLERFAGREELALAAYNAGPGAVQRAGMRVPPYPETRLYVERVLGYRAALRQNAALR